MNYYVGADEYTLRKDVKRKFEIQMDMEAEQIPEENLLSIIEMLRRERAVYIDTPTPEFGDTDSDDVQMSLFG